MRMTLIGHFNNVNKGTIYKSQNGIYIMKDDFQGWCKSPEQEISNWVKIINNVFFVKNKSAVWGSLCIASRTNNDTVFC